MVNQREADVLSDRERVEECAILEQHPKPTADLVQLGLIGRCHIGSEAQHLALIWTEEPHDVLQGDALARTRGTDDRGRLSLRNLERDVSKDGVVPEGLIDIAKLDHSAPP